MHYKEAVFFHSGNWNWVQICLSDQLLSPYWARPTDTRCHRHQSELPAIRAAASISHCKRQADTSTGRLLLFYQINKNLCKWGAFLRNSFNSLVEVTVNKTSAEITRGAAHEMGIHIAGAAQNLVAKLLLNNPSHRLCGDPNKNTSRRKREPEVLRSFRILLPLGCFRPDSHPF